MKALREAKAYLSGIQTDGYRYDHPISLLARLVEAVNDGIITCVTRDAGGGAIYDERLTQAGQRVRVVAVGEDG